MAKDVAQRLKEIAKELVEISEGLGAKHDLEYETKEKPDQVQTLDAPADNEDDTGLIGGRPDDRH